MNNFPKWVTASSLCIVVGATGTIAPLMSQSPALAVSFTDTRSHWSRPFIEALADRQIIAGYSDGTFKPDKSVSRAEFSAMLRQAFNNSKVRTSRGFNDVPSKFWAASAIDKAYETGFMSGYPGGLFKPTQEIPRVQVLVSLASGLGLSPRGTAATTVGFYRDASQIPEYAVGGVAAATEKNMVVNYPNVNYLNPNETATRADVAAFIYQALVDQGRLPAIAGGEGAANYIVKSTSTGTAQNPNPVTPNPATPNARFRVIQGTSIPVRYLASDKIVVSRGETINNLTMRVGIDLKNAQGETIIPRDSEIQGQLVPVTSGTTVLGTQFVAQRLVIGNQTYNLNASSQVVTGKQQNQPITQTTVGNAAASTATQLILSTILGGGVNLGNILTGATGGNAPAPTTATANDLIVVDPETDLQLRLGSDFYANSMP